MAGPKKADVFDDYEDFPCQSVGSLHTLVERKVKKKTREFPPGFHGANPGPSYDEDEPEPAKPARRARTKKVK